MSNAPEGVWNTSIRLRFGSIVSIGADSAAGATRRKNGMRQSVVAYYAFRVLRKGSRNVWCPLLRSECRTQITRTVGSILWRWFIQDSILFWRTGAPVSQSLNRNVSAATSTGNHQDTRSEAQPAGGLRSPNFVWGGLISDPLKCFFHVALTIQEFIHGELQSREMSTKQ